MTDKKTVTVDVTLRSPDVVRPFGRDFDVYLTDENQIDYDCIIHNVIDDLYGIEKGGSLTISIK